MFFREWYVQNTFFPIWTKLATVAFVRSKQKRWTEIFTIQRKLTLPFTDQILRLMYMHIIIYTNKSQTCQTIYMTQMLKFLWLYLKIKFKAPDIDECFFVFRSHYWYQGKESNTQDSNSDNVVSLCRYFSVSEPCKVFVYANGGSSANWGV